VGKKLCWIITKVRDTVSKLWWFKSSTEVVSFLSFTEKLGENFLVQ